MLEVHSAKDLGTSSPSLLLLILILILLLIVILILLSGYRQEAQALQFEKLRGDSDEVVFTLNDKVGRIVKVRCYDIGHSVRSNRELT